MNINTDLHKQILAAANDALGDYICPSSLRNTKNEIYAMKYTDNLLIRIFHCKKERCKSPTRGIAIAFSAGFFCQMLAALSDKDDAEKMEFILSVMSDDAFAMEGRMVGILLNSDAESIKKLHDVLQEKTVEACQFLTHQKIELRTVQDAWTMLYTVFMIGVAIKTNYRLAQA